MPEVIDELLVRLGLNVDQRSFDVANAQFTSLTNRISRFMGVAGAVGGVAAIGGAMYGLANSAAQAAQNISLIAERTRESVENISRYQSAFRSLTGIADTSAIDQYVTKIADWRNNLTPENPDYEWIERSGFHTQSIVGAKSNKEAIDYIIDQWGSLSDLQKQTAQQHGIVPTEIGLMADQGRSRFDSSFANAKNVFTDDMVRNAQAFNQTLRDLKQNMETLGQNIGNDVIPVFNRLFTGLNKWFDDHQHGVKNAVDFTGQFLSGGNKFDDPDMLVNRLADKIFPEFHVKNWSDFKSLSGHSFYDPSKHRNAAPQSVVDDIGSFMDSPVINTNGAGSNSKMSISDALWRSLIHQESRGNHNAVSPKGAFGVAQLMPGTARNPGFGIQGIRDNSREENERVGREYLNALFNKYGDLRKALAAYNFGIGNMDGYTDSNGMRHKGALEYGANWFDHLPQETRNYVPQILGRANRTGGVGGGTRNYYTIDARGAQDPSAVQAAAEQAFRRFMISATLVAGGNFPDDSSAA